MKGHNLVWTSASVILGLAFIVVAYVFPSQFIQLHTSSIDTILGSDRLSAFSAYQIIIASVGLAFILLSPIFSRLSHVEKAALVLVLLCTVIFAKSRVNFSIAPFEDAAILMRYAEHFAQGHGLVWNIGEPPVDGATDFLLTIVIGLIVKLGMSVEHATRFVSSFAHVLTIALIFIAQRRLSSIHVLFSMASVLYFAIGPGLYFVAAYFGTPLFALGACLTWYIALLLMREPSSHSLSIYFAFAGLITGLIRPEGVILATLMLMAIVYAVGLEKSRFSILSFFLIFLVLGGSYFVWRWSYFGYVFPNPFYKKGGGTLHTDGLMQSIINLVSLCLPFLVGYLAVLTSPKKLRFAIASLIPIVGFTFAFVLLSSEMNFGGRFQYALLPIMLLTAPLTIDHLQISTNSFSIQRISWQTIEQIVVTFTVILTLLAYIHYSHHPTYNIDGRYAVATILADYQDEGYTIVTTEAGLLPLYSRWNAVDAWGLNDQWIAHNGGITSQYLEKIYPEIIMFHDYFSPLVPHSGSGERFDMIMVLKEFAEDNDYQLAAVYGESPFDTHYYYVRTNFPHGSEIINRIQNVDYPWYAGSHLSINWLTVSNNSKE